MPRRGSEEEEEEDELEEGGRDALRRPTPGYPSHTAITREQSRPDK